MGAARGSVEPTRLTPLHLDGHAIDSDLLIQRMVVVILLASNLCSCGKEEEVEEEEEEEV